MTENLSKGKGALLSKGALSLYPFLRRVDAWKQERLKNLKDIIDRFGLID